MSLPNNPSHGAVGYLNGISYQFDAVHNKWFITKTNIEVDQLSDVSTTPANDDEVLAWDSDNQQWTPISIQQALGATGQKINVHTVGEGELDFELTNTPIGDVVVIKNGVQLPTSYYNVVGRIVYYTNNGYPLKPNDLLQFIYNNGSNVGFSAELNDLTDVSYTQNTLEQNDVLGWDSDSQSFKSYNLQNTVTILENRIAELEGDLAQAVSDRVYTDNTLSARITDNDSDISTSGKFYVQATPPTGGPHSGWVNTTNMKLNVWDTGSEVWTEISLT